MLKSKAQCATALKSLFKKALVLWMLKEQSHHKRCYFLSSSL